MYYIATYSEVRHSPRFLPKRTSIPAKITTLPKTKLMTKVKRSIFMLISVLSTGLIMWIGHREEIPKLTFRALAPFYVIAVDVPPNQSEIFIYFHVWVGLTGMLKQCCQLINLVAKFCLHSEKWENWLSDHLSSGLTHCCLLFWYQ